MLRELHRVLKGDGVFAFEQWPADPNQNAFERINWFIDGGPPIVHYSAGMGLHSRTYFIYITPESCEGQLLSDVATRLAGELSAEQRQVCEGIKDKIASGAFYLVEKAVYSGENGSLAADEFPSLLADAGFSDVVSCAVPDAKAFASALRDAGVLSRLEQQDLMPCLRALVRSAPRRPGWVETHVTCRRT